MKGFLGEHVKSLYIFYKENDMIPFLVCRVCFLISAIFSIFLFRGQGYEEYAKVLFSIFAIPIELMKYYLPAKAFEYFKTKTLVCILVGLIYLFIAMFVFYGSITATQGFCKTQEAMQHNDYVKNSDEYKNKQLTMQSDEDIKNIIKEQIEYFKAQNKLLEQEKTKEVIPTNVDDLKRKIDMKNSNGKYTYTFEQRESFRKQISAAANGDKSSLEQTRSNIQQEIISNNQIIKEYNDSLINGSYRKTKEVSNESNLEIQSTKGLSAAFDSKVSQNNFYVLMSYLFEVIGIIAYIEDRRRRSKAGFISFGTKVKNEIMNKADKIVNPKSNDNVITATNNNELPNMSINEKEVIVDHNGNEKRKIGFNVDNDKNVKTSNDIHSHNFDNPIIMKYINRMKASINKNMEVDGYQKISKDLGISGHLGNKIYGHLEEIGYIGKSSYNAKKTMMLKDV